MLLQLTEMTPTIELPYSLLVAFLLSGSVLFIIGINIHFSILCSLLVFPFQIYFDMLYLSRELFKNYFFLSSQGRNKHIICC